MQEVSDGLFLERKFPISSLEKDFKWIWKEQTNHMKINHLTDSHFVEIFFSNPGIPYRSDRIERGGFDHLKA